MESSTESSQLKRGGSGQDTFKFGVLGPGIRDSNDGSRCVTQVRV